jgi:NDP-sugar pyrophosphorylase family protein
MVPVSGRPFLEFILEHLASQDFRRVLLLVGHRAEAIRNHFGDGTRVGCKIEYAQETSLLGTGGAIRNAWDCLEDEFLLLYGDSFLPIDYRAVQRSFHRSPCSGVLVLCDNRVAATGVRNNVAVDENGFVIRYDKTSGDPGLEYVDAGVLCLARDAFLEVPRDTVVSMEIDIFPRWIARRRLRAYLTSQRFFDIGTPARLQEFAALQQ